MKKSYLVTVALTLLVIAFAAGCASSPDSGASVGGGRVIIGAYGDPRPDWDRTLPKDADVHYFKGIGRGAQTETAKRGTATADALAQLSRWKEAKIGSALKDYVQESGTHGNTQALQDFEQTVVAKAVANTSGFMEVDSWVDQNGNYHILYSYPNADVMNDFKSTANTFVRNQAAAFAEFKADEAFRMLEAEMAKDD
ncbi:MAG: LPP20 family lipoprotein [Spirochaetaceae bacterium]|nr:LPP20 family lipoprotein [Spirochaetaceae bacterium]